MADAPAEILYGYVTADFRKLLQDTADIGDQPDMETYNGKVQISADVPGGWLRITAPGHESMATLQNHEVPIINGKMSGFGPGGLTSLIATNTAHVSPAPFQYTARFVLDGATTQPPTVRFNVPAGETIHLDRIVSLPPVAPVTVVVSTEAALRAEAAAAEAEALIEGGIGPAVEAYLTENPPTSGGSDIDAWSDVAALPGFPTTFAPTIGSTSSTAAAGNDPRLSDTRVPTDSSVTNAKVASNAAISLDKTADSATRLAMTAAERTKLTGIATSATANSTDSALRDRSTHTGSQTSATISDFTEAVQDAVAGFLSGTSGVSVTYDDTNNTLTLTGSGAAGIDAEGVRDAIGVAMVGAGNITVVANDAADTITISTTATVNATDAALRDRSTHTGTQAQSTITNLTTDLAAKAPLNSPAFTGTPTGITKSHIGLPNVDNTSDANKPVSTAQATAINARVPISSGVRPRIRATALNTWPDRAAWITANYPGYVGPVDWDSLQFSTQTVSPPIVADDGWWKRSA